MTVRTAVFAVCLGIAASMLQAVPAAAHHSFSMFDRGKTVTMKGTIKSLDWINPHAWLQIFVTAADGQQDVWSLEMGGVGQIQRQGWQPTTVKPGDAVEVRMHPLKDGSYAGSLFRSFCLMGKDWGNAKWI